MQPSQITYFVILAAAFTLLLTDVGKTMEEVETDRRHELDIVGWIGQGDDESLARVERDPGFLRIVPVPPRSSPAGSPPSTSRSLRASAVPPSPTW